MTAKAAVRGLVAGVVGVAAMTFAEKVEQLFTHRPNSYVPAHTLARLLRLSNPDKDRLVLNWIMHWGQGIVLGAVRCADRVEDKPEMTNFDNQAMSEAQVKVYGADWCGHTRQTLQHLDESGVAYQYINVEEDKKASEWVKAQNNGLEIKPTLEIGGEILTAPANPELDDALRQCGLLK